MERRKRTTSELQETEEEIAAMMVSAAKSIEHELVPLPRASPKSPSGPKSFAVLDMTFVSRRKAVLQKDIELRLRKSLLLSSGQYG